MYAMLVPRYVQYYKAAFYTQAKSEHLDCSPKLLFDPICQQQS